MTSISIDDLDRRILQELITDSTRSHKQIGGLVHLTGQAVGARIRKMQDLGIIEGYSVRWNPALVGQPVLAFVTVFLSSNVVHAGFQAFAKSHGSVAELHRVSGEGCYWMRVRAADQAELNGFLDELLKYGNYRVNLSLGEIQ